MPCLDWRLNGASVELGAEREEMQKREEKNETKYFMLSTTTATKGFDCN